MKIFSRRTFIATAASLMTLSQSFIPWRKKVVLELCEMILTQDSKNRAAQLMKIVSLLALGKATDNSPAANYYTTFATLEKNKLKNAF